MRVFKLVRSDMRAIYDGVTKYEVGARLEVPNAPKNGAECGVGLHYSETIEQALKCVRGLGDRSHRPRQILELEVDPADVLGQGSDKARARAVTVTRVVPWDEYMPGLLGRLKKRVELVHAEIDTWKGTPWLAPPKKVTEASILSKVAHWQSCVAPFRRKGAAQSSDVPVVVIRDREEAVRLARSRWYAAADAAADAAAAADDAAAGAAWRAKRESILSEHAPAMLERLLAIGPGAAS